MKGIEHRSWFHEYRRRQLILSCFKPAACAGGENRVFHVFLTHGYELLRSITENLSESCPVPNGIVVYLID